MSIRQMLSAREILVIVPDARKASAVKATIDSEISPHVSVNPPHASARHALS
jgi:6-phosphogluconolactonase/glucosamine-6-phosphate isomerase/deaminase